MIDVIKEMIAEPIVVRALIVGVLVSLCASLLGVSLVLKRYSMIGDGLSHVGFSSMALATVLNTKPLIVSIPIVVLAAFLLLRVSESIKIKGDALIALVSTSSLAAGVMIVSLSTGMNTDVCNYLFGSLFSLTKSDVRLSIGISVIILIAFVFLYNRIFAATFDESFSRATGVSVSFYNSLLAMLTAFIIVLGMRMIGSLLISSLIIFPPLSSMRIFKKFKSVVLSSALIAVICLLVGIYVSYEYSAPGGASIVLCNMVIFTVFSIISLLSGRNIQK